MHQPKLVDRMPVTPTVACTLENPCDCDDLRFSSDGARKGVDMSDAITT